MPSPKFLHVLTKKLDNANRHADKATLVTSSWMNKPGSSKTRSPKIFFDDRTCTAQTVNNTQIMYSATIVLWSVVSLDSDLQFRSKTLGEASKDIALCS